MPAYGVAIVRESSDWARSAPSTKSRSAGRSPGAAGHSARTSSPSTGSPWAGMRRRYSPATSPHRSAIGRPSTAMTTRSASAPRTSPKI